MADLSERFRINLNQNLWGLLLSFVALGFGEYYRLTTLYWFAGISSVVALLSVFLTTIAYTLNYWKMKRKP